MSDTVFIKALRAKAVIGVFEWERRIRQDVVLDIEMSADLSAAERSDDIADTCDYKAVAKRVVSFITDSRFTLMETLAGRIAALILDEFAVKRVRVHMAKPGAVRGADSVGVTVERPV